MWPQHATTTTAAATGKMKKKRTEMYSVAADSVPLQTRNLQDSYDEEIGFKSDAKYDFTAVSAPPAPLPPLPPIVNSPPSSNNSSPPSMPPSPALTVVTPAKLSRTAAAAQMISPAPSMQSASIYYDHEVNLGSSSSESPPSSPPLPLAAYTTPYAPAPYAPTPYGLGTRLNDSYTSSCPEDEAVAALNLSTVHPDDEALTDFVDHRNDGAAMGPAVDDDEPTTGNDDRGSNDEAGMNDDDAKGSDDDDHGSNKQSVPSSEEEEYVVVETGNVTKEELLQPPIAEQQLDDHRDKSILSSPAAGSPSVAGSSVAATMQPRRQSTCWYRSFLLVIVVAIIVGVAVPLARRKSDGPVPRATSNNSTTTVSTDSQNVTGGNEATPDNTSNATNSTTPATPPPPASAPSTPATTTTTTAPSATPTTARPTGPNEAQRPALLAWRAELEQGAVVTPVETAARDQALDWMLQQDGLPFDNNAALRQRYSVVALAFGLQQEATGRRLANGTALLSTLNPLLNECTWPGVNCTDSAATAAPAVAGYGDTAPPTAAPAQVVSVDNGQLTRQVTAISWANQNLTGVLLSEVAFLSQLTLLDVGDNQLHGSIPEALYSLTNLERLYLLQNSLTGTLSSSLANLTKLQYLLLNNNQLHGTIPAEIGSTQFDAGVVRPLRKWYPANSPRKAPSLLTLCSTIHLLPRSNLSKRK
jgi:Leucine rich repeat